MALSLLLAIFLAISASAQEGNFNSDCFHGLNDADSSATLNPCESPDLLNTESNLNGTAILKRKGYALSSAMSVSTSPITGSHSFIDGNGNAQTIVCQDRNCSKSTNGNAFTTFLTTAGGSGSMPTRFSFVDVGGILYGANDVRDPILRWDGTTRTSATGIPQGSILELTQDRLLVGDIASLPNRVSYSSAGAYEQFTVGVNDEDSFFDEIGTGGDRIRGIKCIGGYCYFFKNTSITVCDVSDQYNTGCSVISPNIGTSDPASIVAAGPTLYFRSQDRSYWELNNQSINQISKKIPNFINSQTGGANGGNNTNTQTSKTDWQAGVQSPLLSWNTEGVNGSIYASSSALIDTSSVQFAAGTLSSISATDSPGEISLSSQTFLDNFADGNFTSNPTWTDLGNMTVSGGELFNSLDSGGAYVTQTISTGSFRFQTRAFPNSGNISETKFMSAANSLASGGGYALRVEHGASTTANLYLIKYPGGSVLASSVTTPANGPDSLNTYIVTRSSAGNFLVYSGSTSNPAAIAYTDNSYNTSAFMVVDCGPGNCGWDYFNFLAYAPQGVFTSRIFDTGFTTPIGGTLAFSSATPTAAGMAFSIHSSTSPNNDFWGAYSPISNGAKITQVSRYWQYISTFTTAYSTVTPSVQDVTLIAATTGQFYTQCIQPGSSISSWGTLSCAESNVGNGSIVYYTTSAATCGTLPTSDPSTWQTTISNNATIAVSTNVAFRVGFRSLLGSATDQAQVDSCIASWTEGTATQGSWGVFYSVKNAVYWTTTINNATSANRLLKYDRNLDSWYPFDIAAAAPRVINNVLYFGSPSAGNWYRYGGEDADAGSSISAYWKSKDVGSDSPFVEKSFKTVSILSKNNGSGSMTGTWTLSNAQTGTYNISLSTGTGISYARSNFNLPIASPQQFMNIKFSNNSSTPFEVLGFGLTWQALSWRTGGP